MIDVIVGLIYHCHDLLKKGLKNYGFEQALVPPLGISQFMC